MSLTGLSDAVGPIPVVTSFPAADSFVLAGLPMPGKWILTDCRKEFGWKIAQGYSLDGAYPLPKGDPLVVAKFRGELWQNTDMTLYAQIRKRLFTRGSVTVGILSMALGISHPELQALGVTAVVLLAQHALVQADGGLWIGGLEFLQFRAPAPSPPRPKFAIPSAANPLPTAQVAQQAELKKLQAGVAAIQGQF